MPLAEVFAVFPYVELKNLQAYTFLARTCGTFFPMFGEGKDTPMYVSANEVDEYRTYWVVDMQK